MRIAYFDCFSGISGDMVLGALLDAGLDINILSKELKKLKLKGYELKKRKVMRQGITGTKFDIIVKSGAAHRRAHRSLKEILRLIDESPLKSKVKETAAAIFNNIGKAEAKIHGISDSGGISLHELGDIDSILDIVGAGIALDSLGIEGIYSSPIHFGRTLISTRHGLLPAPSPASLELLKDVPSRISEIEGELVTPTGAGILKTLSKSFGEMPQMRISSIGYGAGTAEFEGLPNMLRVMIGRTEKAFKEDRIFVIETNIDDMNPQNFAYIMDRLFNEGALDVYTASIQMKKSRPAFKLTVLSEPDKLEKMCSVIFSETTSIGLRYYEASRYKLERKTVKVKTRFGRLSVKLSAGAGGVMTASPEYEECAKAAATKKVPLKKVYEEAARAAQCLR
jgi:pyridinium-3,5-bisthiocarboxylic acid mononucleotide nickel chelatase